MQVIKYYQYYCFEDMDFPAILVFRFRGDFIDMAENVTTLKTLEATMIFNNELNAVVFYSSLILFNYWIEFVWGKLS